MRIFHIKLVYGGLRIIDNFKESSGLCQARENSGIDITRSSNRLTKNMPLRLLVYQINNKNE